MEKKAGSFQFVAATIILVSIAAISFAGTAMARTAMTGMSLGGTNIGAAELESCYREKERQLVRDTRRELERQGFITGGGWILTGWKRRSGKNWHGSCPHLHLRMKTAVFAMSFL